MIGNLVDRYIGGSALCKKNIINASAFVCRKRFDWWFPAIGTGTK